MPRLISDLTYNKDFKLGREFEGSHSNGLISFTRLYTDMRGVALATRIVGTLKDIVFDSHKDLWILEPVQAIQDLFCDEDASLDSVLLHDRRDTTRTTVSQKPWCMPGTIFVKANPNSDLKRKDRSFTFGDIIVCEVLMQRQDSEIPAGLNLAGLYKRCCMGCAAFQLKPVHRKSVLFVNPLDDGILQLLSRLRRWVLCMHFACYDCMFHWLNRGRMFFPFCGERVHEQPIRNEGFEMALADAFDSNVVRKAPAQLGKKISGDEAEYVWDGIVFEFED
ncbi:hypothetical protein B0H13DRAFT_1851164 [Mycena leptocephala]|nr:hypothetical protein B0H13DRAFT_1851164 [Mycena leptocephala]